ncbi:MAG TPA: cyclic nucleotide-binding domain-containing protein, partial [Chitinophagaceae bacterium]|nr:cyclic nucleotide-binding domain-containing protein [Chitinophagaceae bacterium]
MDITGHFLSYLRKFINLSDEEFNQYLLPVINIRKPEKKEILTHAGEVENNIFFIVKGLVRKYYLKHNDEINTQLSYEGHIIHSQESFHSRTPSEYFVETIEPCVMISMTYDDLEALFAKSHRMEHMGRLIITHT